VAVAVVARGGGRAAEVRGNDDVDILDTLVLVSKAATHFSSGSQIGSVRAAITSSQAFRRLWSTSWDS